MDQVWIALSEEDWRWLTRVIANTVAKAHGMPSIWCDVGPGYERVLEALNAAVTKSPDGDGAMVVAKEMKKPRKKRGEGKVATAPKLCDQHPLYGAQRPPRTSCRECWKAYAKYAGPSVADRARRKAGIEWEVEPSVQSNGDSSSASKPRLKNLREATLPASKARSKSSTPSASKPASSGGAKASTSTTEPKRTSSKSAATSTSKPSTSAKSAGRPGRRSKLSAKDIAFIKRSKLPQKELAAKYGVSQPYISLIRKRGQASEQ